MVDYTFYDQTELKNLTNEALVKEFQEGNETAFNALLTKNEGLIYFVFKKVYKLGANKYSEEDVIQEIKIGMLKAARKFDLNKKVKFVTYAMFWMRQGAQRYIMNLCVYKY